jgi:hypothetical protein
MGVSRSIVAAVIHASCSIVFLAFGVMTIRAAEPDTSRHDPSVLLEQGDAFADFDALPVWPGKTSTVHRAVEGQWQYNLHAYLIFHEGRFWAMWSAGYKDEGARGQRIHYATSTNGHAWNDTKMLDKQDALSWIYNASCKLRSPILRRQSWPRIVEINMRLDYLFSARNKRLTRLGTSALAGNRGLSPQP